MRIRKVLLGTAVALGAVSLVGRIYVTHEGESGSPGAQRRADGHDGDAGAGDAGRQAVAASLSRIQRTDGVDPQHRAAGARRRLSRSASGADGADVKRGDLLYKIDTRDLQAALDQANAQAQRDAAASTTPAPITIAARSSPRAGSSPKIRSINAKARWGRPRRRWPWIKPPCGQWRSISSYAEIRAPFDGRTRAQPGAGRHARQRRRRAAQHARAA